MKILCLVIIILISNFICKNTPAIKKDKIDLLLSGPVKFTTTEYADKIDTQYRFFVTITNYSDSTFIPSSSDTLDFYPGGNAWLRREKDGTTTFLSGGILDQINQDFYKMKIGEKRTFHFDWDRIETDADTVVFGFSYYSDEKLDHYIEHVQVASAWKHDTIIGKPRVSFHREYFNFTR